MRGREQGNVKTTVEEGVMLPEPERKEKMGRDWAGTWLVREVVGPCTGSVDAAGIGVGATSALNPVGQSPQHCRVQDVDGTAENGDRGIVNQLPASV